ncbi:MAG: hypothetical protein ACYS9X_29370, partial [Planctomycetota bacterium]
ADVGPKRRKVERAERAVEWWAKLASGEPSPSASGEDLREDPLADLRAIVEKLRRVVEAEEARAREAREPGSSGESGDMTSAVDASGGGPDPDGPFWRAIRRIRLEEEARARAGGEADDMTSAVDVD